MKQILLFRALCWQIRQGELIPTEHQLVSSYLRINLYKIHTHFSSTFPSCTSEISVHAHLFLMVLLGRKILPKIWKVGMYLQKRFCTETAEVLSVWLNYRFWDTFASSDSLSIAEINAGTGMILQYSSKSDCQQNLQAWHSIRKFYFFFNRSLNRFLCHSKQPCAITC